MNSKKHSPGRPPLPRSRLRRINMGLRLDQDTASKLKKYSMISGIPRATLIRQAVKAFLEKEMARLAA